MQMARILAKNPPPPSLHTPDTAHFSRGTLLKEIVLCVCVCVCLGGGGGGISI